jgi:protein arginine kinase activator
MVCDNCGSGNAVVHLTQIVNNKMSVHHLSKLPVTEFLAQMGKEDPPEPSKPRSQPCSFCGLEFSEFRRTGRLGCPHCYVSFEQQIRNLLRRIHGGSEHMGKVYLPPDPSSADVQRRLGGLRRRLERAVSAEDFERAAEIRDQIRALEPKVG